MPLHLALIIRLLAATLPLEGRLDLPRPPDSSRLTAIADSLVSGWQEEGHLLAKVDILSEGRFLAWKIQPGPTLQWRRIASTGDTVFTPATMQRLSGIRQGSRATMDALRKAQERIAATGCADLPDPPRLQGQRGTTWADAWIATWRVPCSQAQAALGWESKLGFQGLVDVQLVNLLGTARSGSLTASARGKVRDFDLQWHEPWLGDWDIGLDAQLELQETELHQMRRAMLQGLFPAPSGTWIAGIEAWIDLSGPADSIREVSALGTTLGWKWTSSARSGWLRPERRAEILFTSLQTEGTPQPWLLRSRSKLTWGWALNAWLALTGGLDAQGLFPMDSLTAIGEARPMGGSSNWKGHQEGQFQTAQWVVGDLELRAGTSGWGAAAFFSPGAVWLWKSNGPRPVPGFGSGFGLRWEQQKQVIRLDLAGGEDTRSWQDIYLHLTLQSRF